MAEAFGDPAAWRAFAVSTLDAHLRDRHGARGLSASELQRYPKRTFTHGWRLPLPHQCPSALDVLVDAGFPYSAVRVALPNGPDPLDWAHIEFDGVLCILPGTATVSSRDPVAVTESVLNDALSLIEGCIAGNFTGDLRAEFSSYWLIASAAESREFISLIEPRGPSRPLISWHGQSFNVCAEDIASLRGWLLRWGAPEPEGGFTFHNAQLVWLAEPMLPPQYPRTASDLRHLVKDLAPEALADLESFAAEDAAHVDVIIGADTDNGACFAGLTLDQPEASTSSRGFRPGHVPNSIKVGRFFGAGKARRSIVHRADHDWIHGRDQDEHQARLKTAKVLVLGCGAIGAGVVRLLAQSGVGRLTLVDDQTFDWPNLSRHVLGASAFRQNKAIGLAATLKGDFPHLSGIEGLDLHFDLGAAALIDQLHTFDLIIDATADWAVSALLNDLQRARANMPPITYGWLEPAATAAHAVTVAPNDSGGCLRCGFDDLGKPTLVVTTWPHGEPIKHEPACGATYSPFGAVDLAWSHALLAEAALDVLLGRTSSTTARTWIGQHGLVKAAGGDWDPVWRERISDPGDGGFVVERGWPAVDTCPYCNRMEVVPA